MCLKEIRLFVISILYEQLLITHFEYSLLEAILAFMMATTETASTLVTPDPLAVEQRRSFVDLRSDTVTLPTPEMLERMCSAELGDDGLDGDPTVRRLETRVAEILGKAAGLFVPTATMGNLLAVLTQVARQGQVVMEASSHMYLAERGGATLAGVMYQGVAGQAGAMDLQVLERAMQPSSTLRTELVCLETTHVNAGGAVLSLEHMGAVQGMAHGAGAKVHVDGARIFNAAQALGVPVDRLTCFADTVSVCLSKGLSAPAGAVLVGPAETMAHARSLRKMLGGTQRQIGVLAAAGLEAVERMRARLAQDHALARQLSTGLRDLRPGRMGITEPASNIVFVDLADNLPDSSAWAQELKKRGVLIRPWGARRIRLVTHRHIDQAAIDVAVLGFRQAADALLG